MLGAAGPRGLLPVTFRGQNASELRNDGILRISSIQRSRGCSIPGIVQSLVGLGAPWDRGRCPCPGQGMGWDSRSLQSNPFHDSLLLQSAAQTPNPAPKDFPNPAEMEFLTTAQLPFFPLNPRFLQSKTSQRKAIPKYPSPKKKD